jgi:heme exporter protein CcmD
LGYVIAAYGVVIGALIVYGLWVRAQRRALRQELEANDDTNARPGAP